MHFSSNVSQKENNYISPSPPLLSLWGEVQGCSLSAPHTSSLKWRSTDEHSNTNANSQHTYTHNRWIVKYTQVYRDVAYYPEPHQQMQTQTCTHTRVPATQRKVMSVHPRVAPRPEWPLKEDTLSVYILGNPQTRTPTPTGLKTLSDSISQLRTNTHTHWPWPCSTSQIIKIVSGMWGMGYNRHSQAHTQKGGEVRG